MIWANHVRPGQGLGVVDLIRADRPEQAHRIVLEPQEVRRLTIRDAGNEPIAGARVAARLVQTERTGYLGTTIPDEWLDRLSATADARGVAVLPGLTHRIELRSVRVEVPNRGVHVMPLRYVDGIVDATITLGTPRARLQGRVEDASGRPVAGRDRRGLGAAAGSPSKARRRFYVVPERVRLDGGPIRTAARGAFQVPGRLMDAATYRSVVRADGFAPTVTDWVALHGESMTLPPVTVRRLRTIAGRVVDRQGKAVASVSVSQPGGGPSSRQTDETGRFRLDGAGRPGRSFLLARARGLRAPAGP